MSAITGIGEKRTIRGSASASSSFGTATRTISQPADASAAICAVVASTSCVFVSVIDWTTTGAPPPIVTPPTWIWRSLATDCQSSQGGLREPEPQRIVEAQSAACRRRRSFESAMNVSRRISAEADDGDALVDLARERAAPDPLDQREEDVPAVERQEAAAGSGARATC